MGDRTRVTLYQTESNLGHYQTTSISKLYALNNQILAGFESRYRNGLLEVAFYMGLKFAETALLQIPKHGYFYSTKHQGERCQSSTDSIRVTQLLQQIIALEPEGLVKECHKIEVLHYLAREQFERLETYESKRAEVEEDFNKHYNNTNVNDSATRGLRSPKPRKGRPSPYGLSISSGQDCMSSTILACGDSFSSIFCPSAASSTTEAAVAIRDEFTGRKKKEEISNTFPDADKKKSTTKRSIKSFPDAGTQKGISSFPTSPVASKSAKRFPGQLADDDPDLFPLFSPSRQTSSGSYTPRNKAVLKHRTSDYIPPASVHKSTQSDFDLERALFLSGLKVGLQDKALEQNRHSSFRQDDEAASDVLQEEARDKPPAVMGPPGAKKRQSSLGVTTELFTDFMQQDFKQLQKSGRVRITQVSTYQGKNPLSTNGCAVIAPLLCIHHFLNESTIPDHGLLDCVVEEVIDKETPNLVSMIRKNLGLVDSAFLIPSDAHEALMQQQLLSEKQFRNVLGGNILDETHLRPLIDELTQIGDKKIGATFFFHEHVVSILQLRRDKKTVWFDLIDSLPHEETLCCRPAWDSSRNNEDISKIGNDDSFRILSDYSDADVVAGVVVDDFPAQEPAARIRCLDAEALRIALQWYACSVFSIENAAYVDTYQWDDNLADFDPRVFQAFIWSAA